MRRRAWAFTGVAVAALWAGNSSWLHGAPGRPPLLLAHRGVAQTFPIAELRGDEDTSKLIAYFALGWTGYVPAACRRTELRIPLRFAPLFWGWPHRLVERMSSVETRVVLVAGDGRWSQGFDSSDSLHSIPEGFAGVIWTNRIDRIGPALKRRGLPR